MNYNDENIPSQQYNTKTIPKEEDRYVEFKNYSIDQNYSDNKRKVYKERIAKAVCAFGNSNKGGTIYFGINDNNIISGLENGKYIDTNYRDRFARHVDQILSDYLKNKLFCIRKIVDRKFQNVEPITREYINSKTNTSKLIYIIRILVSDVPLYINGKFYVRTAIASTGELAGNDLVNYITTRNPKYDNIS